jgi:hypothetical protein
MRVIWLITMEILTYENRMLCWKAGYRDDLFVRFGGRWVETCLSNEVTRHPSTLCVTLFEGKQR